MTEGGKDLGYDPIMTIYLFMPVTTLRFARQLPRCIPMLSDDTIGVGPWLLLVGLAQPRFFV